MVRYRRVRSQRLRLAGALMGAEVALFTKDPTRLPGWDHEKPGMIFDSIDELGEADYPGYQRIKLEEAPAIEGGRVRWPDVVFERGQDGQGDCWISGWLIVDRSGNVIAGQVPQMVHVATYSGTEEYFVNATCLHPGGSLVVSPEFVVEGF